MRKQKISHRLRERVFQQARSRCGYCQTDGQIVGPVLEVDHMIPQGAGGETVEENLWVACSSCNRHKGSRTHFKDPVSGRRVRFFNPRQQVWSRHFCWSENGTQIIGLTACGRATVEALKMNNSDVVIARTRWVQAGWHPPKD
ncbi:HNH endonuclease [Candidatus Poribacteria bacterium]|nr:HNH endonuclease [Candidatus Poribacteria bacterium]